MSIEKDLHQVALESLYMKPEMIRFLLVENLTLKTLLHEKGLITPEEFKTSQKRASEILQSQMEEMVKVQLSQISEQP